MADLTTYRCPHCGTEVQVIRCAMITHKCKDGKKHELREVKKEAPDAGR